MKTALEKLKELREHDSSIVAIAKDHDENVFFYADEIPYTNVGFKTWWSNQLKCCPVDEVIIFDSINWNECIVTYKDLENFDVENIPISKAEHDRLLE